MASSYDIIIIGAGPGGYETAARAVRSGMRTLLVERDLLGGTCLNRGCIPTKTLCRSAEVAMLMCRAADFGVLTTGDVTLNWSKAMQRKDAVVTALREGVETVLAGVDILYGEARFVEPLVVDVDGHRYTAPKIIVATGSRPASLPIPGAELALDSDALLSLQALPSSIAIIGGGVIGVEFASVLNAFGVKVTVIEYCHEILPGFDADIAKRLRMALKRRGVTVLTGTAARSIAPGFTVACEVKGKEKIVDAEAVLMAVGRRPLIPDGLVELGIETCRGAIVVDQTTMQSSIPGIYAVGDVNGLCMLAHAATAQGLVALGVKQSLSPVPAAVFTEPECAMVGLTEQQCVDRGINYMKGETIFRANGKAMAMDLTDGMVKVLVEAGSLAILGCHICGAHASDLIPEMAIAIEAGITAPHICETIHSHPSLSELVAVAVGKALGDI